MSSIDVDEASALAAALKYVSEEIYRIAPGLNNIDADHVQEMRRIARLFFVVSKDISDEVVGVLESLQVVNNLDVSADVKELILSDAPATFVNVFDRTLAGWVPPTLSFTSTTGYSIPSLQTLIDADPQLQYEIERLFPTEADRAYLAEMYTWHFSGGLLNGPPPTAPSPQLAILAMGCLGLTSDPGSYLLEFEALDESLRQMSDMRLTGIPNIADRVAGMMWDSDNMYGRGDWTELTAVEISRLNAGDAWWYSSAADVWAGDTDLRALLESNPNHPFFDSVKGRDWLVFADREARLQDMARWAEDGEAYAEANGIDFDPENPPAGFAPMPTLGAWTTSFELHRLEIARLLIDSGVDLDNFDPYENTLEVDEELLLDGVDANGLTPGTRYYGSEANQALANIAMSDPVVRAILGLPEVTRPEAPIFDRFVEGMARSVMQTVVHVWNLSIRVAYDPSGWADTWGQTAGGVWNSIVNPTSVWRSLQASYQHDAAGFWGEIAGGVLLTGGSRAALKMLGFDAATSAWLNGMLARGVNPMVVSALARALTVRNSVSLPTSPRLVQALEILEGYDSVFSSGASLLLRRSAGPGSVPIPAGWVMGHEAFALIERRLTTLFPEVDFSVWNSPDTAQNPITSVTATINGNEVNISWPKNAAVDPAYIAEAIQATTTLSSDFPGLVRLVSLGDPSHFTGKTSSTMALAYAADPIIAVNPTGLGPSLDFAYGTFGARYLQSVGSSWTIPGSNNALASVIAHEYGHQFLFQLAPYAWRQMPSGSSGTYWRDLSPLDPLLQTPAFQAMFNITGSTPLRWNQIVDADGKFLPGIVREDGISVQVSGYAASNVDELVAEIFSDLNTSPIPKPASLQFAREFFPDGFPGRPDLDLTPARFPPIATLPPPAVPPPSFDLPFEGTG